ncbi:circumsporozoite protein-like [Haliotis rufescens]|uniref:circumsporozoite protein-like n=1 Tax=Haliotis rufescens TaxID=6454 RepID=UPI00201EC25D|nr:circumsporozoite protein-like [Haliotis rufescens]
MASLCVLVLLVAASSVVHGHENIAAVVNQMSLLEKEINHLKVELNHLKSDVPGMETRVINNMDILELLLRSDLTEKIVPSYMRSQIESLDDTVNSHVMSQIRHLKRGYQQMKRQTLSLTRQLREVGQTKTRQPLDTVKDKDACEQQVSELKTELNLTRHHVTHVEKDYWSTEYSSAECILVAREPGVPEVAGERGVPGVAGKAGVREMAGKAGVPEVAGKAGAAGKAGLPGVAGEYWLPEVAEKAGVPEMAEKAWVLEMTGKAGVLEMRGEAGLLEMAGKGGVSEMAGEPWAPCGGGEPGLLEEAE